jgi:hypothetical protein
MSDPNNRRDAYPDETPLEEGIPHERQMHEILFDPKQVREGFKGGETKKNQPSPATMPDPTKEEKKLNTLLTRTDKIIFRVKALFPFDLFPDEIIIDELKITLRRNMFFATEQIFTVMIDEIEDVAISSAWFLSKLYLRRLKQKWDLQPFVIGNLFTKDAKKAKWIILGLMIARSQEIDIGAIPPGKLLVKLQELGQSSNY